MTAGYAAPLKRGLGPFLTPTHRLPAPASQKLAGAGRGGLNNSALRASDRSGQQHFLDEIFVPLSVVEWGPINKSEPKK